MSHKLYSSLAALALLLVNISSGEVLQRTAVLDPDGNYVLNWEVDFDTNVTTFTADVKTTGFVGFGISYTGGMAGADIIVGGVENGQPYFRDYHGVEGNNIIPDTSQDWKLIEAHENATHTILKFSRFLETCDPDDIPIITDATNLIWSFGATDKIMYHGENKGTAAMYLLDPPNPPVDKSEFESWEINITKELPDDDTVYYCSIHKAPSLSKLHHIVGFRANINSKEARDHTHHFVIYKCITPANTTAEEYFGPYAGKEGGDCYVPQPVIPVQDCQYFVYIWSVGGEETFFPDDVGYPFGLEEHEYYMVDLHYDNPTKIPGLNFTTGAQIFYTEKLRSMEAAAISLGHMIYASQLVPPKTVGFTTIGHCSANCTARYLDPEGVTVFNAYLHSHTAGRKVKVRHFRNGTELPWLSYDDHYNFDYQQSRHLRTYVKLLPGDHLTYECTYDTMDREGVTTAGISTRTEMCFAALWHYPASKLEFCMSKFPIQKHYDRWGIEDVEWWHSNYPPKITKPDRIANQTLIEFLDKTLPWSNEFVSEFQKEHLETEHESTCAAPGATEPPEPYYKMTSWPKFESSYEPQQPQCESESTTDPTVTNPSNGTGSTDPNTSTTPQTDSANSLTMHFKLGTALAVVCALLV